ncbi:unnamed protein product [Urochloa decumbens]|uniref:DUF4220 domain-containing protein n=2 Tax=Urochloa decumbens TaxID=240449 RepID=A0ABC9D6Z7_9POAL
MRAHANKKGKKIYMEKPGELVKWSLLFENSDGAVLMRIEFLVVAIAVIFLLMSFLDMFRRQSRHSSIKYLLLVLDAISDSSFIYTIGLMQSAPFRKELFSVWALILVNLRFNACFISAYGIPDQDNSRLNESGKVMALLGVAFLIGTQNSQFKHPIWALWAMQQARSIYLIYAYHRATRSFLHGRSSPLLTAYMGTLNTICQDANPTTMVGYKYLVSGDQKQRVQLNPPRYEFELQVHKLTEKLLITVEKTWELPRNKRSDIGGGDGSTDVKTQWMKDLCLSFALYRLLRCRFDDLPLPANSITHTRRLVYEIIGKNSGDLTAQQVDQRAERTFRIAKLELAFLNDYFYTRYPILFWRGFPLLCAWHPLLTVALIAWLGRDIHKLYKPKEGETAHVVHGANVDLIITWVFMGIIVLKETWKMATYLLSDWTKVMLLCEYTSQSARCIPQCLWEFLVRILCTPRCTIVHRWHNKIGQYELLQSFGYNPWNIPHYLSLGLFPKDIKGAKVGNPTELPADVKAAVLRSLYSHDLGQNSLESELPAYHRQFEWTFLLPTWCHSILVWHIATSLCEIELSQHYNTSLTLSEVLCAVKTALSCFSSQPFVIKESRIEGALRANYVAANSISRYCAYLLVKEPDLLPDRYLTAEDIFQSTINEASDVLNGCDTLQSIYRTLIREGEPQQDIQDGNINIDGKDPNMVLEKAARLAWSLIHQISDEKVRWKVLAEVWADILVHTAPSWNAAAHKKCLATGGEFVTHIWVILSHCNVQRSKRWRYQESPQDAQEGAEGQGMEEENQASPRQESSVSDGRLVAQEAATMDDASDVPSSGTPKEQYHSAAETCNPIPGQRLTTNNQQFSQNEAAEIQEVGSDWKG